MHQRSGNPGTAVQQAAEPGKYGVSLMLLFNLHALLEIDLQDHMSLSLFVVTLTVSCFAVCFLQTPSLACVEMCQCIAQAMPVSVRKGGGKGGDSLAPLLQLPGFTQDVIKKLRKKKINSIAGGCGLTTGAFCCQLCPVYTRVCLW